MYNVTITPNSHAAHTNEFSFLQNPFWAQFKSRHGWTYTRYNISWTCNAKENLIENFSGEIALLYRSFCKKLFSIAYIALFPLLNFESLSYDEEGNQIYGVEDEACGDLCELLNDISKELKKYLPKNTICIRFDPDIAFSNPENRDLFCRGMKNYSFAYKLPLQKNSVDIQPPDSTIIDLRQTEEEILSKMKSKWRYNIRLAEKKGVVVKAYTGSSEEISEKLDEFYALYKTTSERDCIAIHNKEYYLDLLKSSARQIADGEDLPLITLYIAYSENQSLAAIITLFSKRESVYLYGCSGNEKRNYMPAYLLQYRAITDAKKYGSQYYDLYGMPPTDDPNHPMHGLYLFKTGFGGKNIHRIGSFDVTLKAIYKLFTFAEKLRAFYHKIFLKKIRSR